MLEESRMDKKTINRSLQQSRPYAVDFKKGTETTHKPLPRNNKKREGLLATTSKNEPYRKNVPAQRGRGQMDKRPRSHYGSNFHVGGTQNTRVEEDEEPELGSVFVPGSKKQNLNHLLNFTYHSRGGNDRRYSAPRRHNEQRVSFRHHHDLYLRAYCQFVVKDTEDFKATLIDPDMPLKWEQIEEIVVRNTGKLECPICLGTPVAGRVGLCGHVYCWACILHYGAAHEKQPPPCPVCAMTLQVHDMKPAFVVQWEPPAEEVTMKLVRRLRGSTGVEIAPPRGIITDTIETTILPIDKQKEAPFAKLFTATNQQVLDILERDRKEIKDQIMAEIDTTEIVFLEQALELLKVKEEKAKMLYNAPTNINMKGEGSYINQVPTVFEKAEINEKRVDWFDVTDEAASIDVDNSVEGLIEDVSKLDIESDFNPNAKVFAYKDNDNSVEDAFENNPVDEFLFVNNNSAEEFSVNKNDNEIDNSFTFTDIDKQNQAKYFYFYQAEDGQQVFLNSLNVRVLNASWGGLAAAPPTICGRVLHRETYFLTEQTRKHMPCTAHLPLHCAFDVVELDLKEPYVTNTALENYSDHLERRARIRAKHERDEKRRERAYRRNIEGPPRPDHPNTSFEVAFPFTLPSHSPPQMDFKLSGSDEPSPSTSSLLPVEQLSPPTNTPNSVRSFAQITSLQGAVHKPLPPPSPPNEEGTSSGPRAIILSDAIEAALQASPASVSSGKKKKSKPKVVFATGMHRAG